MSIKLIIAVYLVCVLCVCVFPFLSFFSWWKHIFSERVSFYAVHCTMCTMHNAQCVHTYRCCCFVVYFYFTLLSLTQKFCYEIFSSRRCNPDIKQNKIYICRYSVNCANERVIVRLKCPSFFRIYIAIGNIMSHIYKFTVTDFSHRHLVWGCN